LRRARFFGAIAALLAVYSAAMPAQTPYARIGVRVADTSGVAIADAELLLYDDVTRLSSAARTDSVGAARLTIAKPSSSLVLTARKLGYAVVSRRLDVRTDDSLFVEITLSHAITVLPRVGIDASRLPKDRQPFIDAAEIANDTRSILSLSDVMKKLRPDVTYQDRKCLPRHRGAPLMRGPIPATRRDELGEEVYVNGRWIPWEWDPGHLIHSEHIAEVRYVNCFDKSIEGLSEVPWPALYVTLKPGIGWDLKRGSFEDPNSRPTSRAASPVVQRRILGVFDNLTGDPISGVTVVDSGSGTWALTTATGTVDLAFLGAGTWTVYVRKPGYTEQRLSVRISPADSTPITLVLLKSNRRR
jgi:hypothetical protein